MQFQLQGSILTLLRAYKDYMFWEHTNLSLIRITFLYVEMTISDTAFTLYITFQNFNMLFSMAESRLFFSFVIFSCLLDILLFSCQFIACLKENKRLSAVSIKICDVVNYYVIQCIMAWLTECYIFNTFCLYLLSRHSFLGVYFQEK